MSRQSIWHPSGLDNPTHCLCPRSRYNPRNMRPTHPDCPKHGENAEENK